MNNNKEQTNDNQDFKIEQADRKEKNIIVALQVVIGTGVAAWANGALQDSSKPYITSLAPALGYIIAYLLIYISDLVKNGDKDFRDNNFFDSQISTLKSERENLFEKLSLAKTENERASIMGMIERCVSEMNEITRKRVEEFINKTKNNNS
jgi:flavodoxin